jgi:hypothetical protein
MDALKDHYHSVGLQFRLNKHEIQGILNGNAEDWVFTSNSEAFVRYIPGGKLEKYALWIGGVPRVLGHLYTEIFEAAGKAGYDLFEREELA